MVFGYEMEKVVGKVGLGNIISRNRISNMWNLGWVLELGGYG